MNFELVTEALKSERLPVGIVDLESFDENIRSIKEIVQTRGSTQTIRVATK